MSASPALARVIRRCALRYKCCERCGIRAVDAISKPPQDAEAVRRELEETTVQDGQRQTPWTAGGFGDGIPGSVIEMVSTARLRSQQGTASANPVTSSPSNANAATGNDAQPVNSPGAGAFPRNQHPSLRFGRLTQFVNPRSAQLNAMYAAAETDGAKAQEAHSIPAHVFQNPLAGLRGQGSSTTSPTVVIPPSVAQLSDFSLPPSRVPSPSPRSRRASRTSRRRSSYRSRSGSSNSPIAAENQEALNTYRAAGMHDFLAGRGRPRRSSSTGSPTFPDT